MPKWMKLTSTWAIAVVILLAPGEPTDRTAPSRRRATVGAMFEIIREPTGRSAGSPASNSISPSELLSHSPVPGTIRPEPYPADVVIAQPRPLPSTAETCTVEGEASRLR